MTWHNDTFKYFSSYNKKIVKNFKCLGKNTDCLSGLNFHYAIELASFTTCFIYHAPDKFLQLYYAKEEKEFLL